MMDRYLKLLRKLDRPPAGPNWVRFVYDDPVRTAKAILAFAKGQPSFNYKPGYIAAKDRIELRIAPDAALRVASEKGAPGGRIQNKEFIQAFLEYDFNRRYSASNPIGFDTEYFRVSREVAIPVAPLSIIRERGRFVPIFVCGWSSNPLVLRQRRLLMTIYEDAFLSLTDYQDSPAEVLFFPKTEDEIDGQRVRTAEVWRRGDYELLTHSELDESVEIYQLARETARNQILTEMERHPDRPEDDDEPPGGGTLFG
jgi:hypothetical protein